MMFTMCLSAIVTLALIVNVVLWFGYHRNAEAQIRSLGEANRNLHNYIDELQGRCERYRQRTVTDAIEARYSVRAHPANLPAKPYLN